MAISAFTLDDVAGAFTLDRAADVYSGRMPQHSESRVVPYDPDRMFAIVADVEHYPEFLPWVISLRALSRAVDAGKTIVIAEMQVGFHYLRERYTSRIVMDPSARTIDVRQVQGVFRELENRWRFTPEGFSLLLEEFEQLTPAGMDPVQWKAELKEIGDKLTVTCRAMDPTSTEETIKKAHAADVVEGEEHAKPATATEPEAPPPPAEPDEEDAFGAGILD